MCVLMMSQSLIKLDQKKENEAQCISVLMHLEFVLGGNENLVEDWI